MIATLSALAEENRLRIVDLLRGGPLHVGEIVDRLELQQPQVSKHLRILGEAGLVESRPDAQRRIYALDPRPFQELDRWLERYRKHWEENYQRLDDLLDELKTQKTQKTQKKRARPSARKARR